MPTKIKRGQSLLIPFKGGVNIYDSQNKPRMYLTQKAFEKSFPGHLIDREGVELVEYAEVVRCRDCKHRGSVDYKCPMCYTEDSYDEESGYDCWDVDKTVDEGFCHCGEKMDAEVEA